MFVPPAAQLRAVASSANSSKRNRHENGDFFSIIAVMKVLVVYKRESDYARSVMDWLRDFQHQTGKEIEEIDPDTREGEMLCRTYDIMEYPTLVALNNEGQVQNIWRGKVLPTISEVSYYVQDNYRAV